MAGKKKLQQFAEVRAFSNVLEVSFSEVFRKSHPLQGKWSEKVFRNDRPIVLELGCGKGEYTVGLARNYPDQNFIGLDIKGARIWRGAKTCLEEKLTNAQFLRTRIEFIDSFFGKEEVSEIWITFPDPQPRKSKERKRLSSPNFLDKYKKLLKNGGLVHLKTDSRPLYDYSLEAWKDYGLEILWHSDDLDHDLKNEGISADEKKLLGIPTFYEQKFRAEGHKITYIKGRINL